MKRDASQRRVLSSIAQLNREKGLPLTIREVAEAAGFRAHSGVVRHLNRLEAAGAIRRDTGVSRSIQITAKGKRSLSADS